MTDVTHTALRVELLDEYPESLNCTVEYPMPAGATLASEWREIGEYVKRRIVTTEGLTFDTMWVVEIVDLTTGEIFQPADEDQPEWIDPNQLRA